MSFTAVSKFIENVKLVICNCLPIVVASCSLTIYNISGYFKALKFKALKMCVIFNDK